MFSKALSLALLASTSTVISAPVITFEPSKTDVLSQPLMDDVGSAVIQNWCPFDVYYVNVPQQGYGMDAAGTIKPGDNYTASFDDAQIGHSIKLSLTEGDLSNILQFEYSRTMDDRVDYDVSRVNGDPFDQYGYSLDADSGCASVRCERPVDGCRGIYQMPFGDLNPNFYCVLTSNIGLTLCNA